MEAGVCSLWEIGVCTTASIPRSPTGSWWASRLSTDCICHHLVLAQLTCSDVSESLPSPVSLHDLMFLLLSCPTVCISMIPLFFQLLNMPTQPWAFHFSLSTPSPSGFTYFISFPTPTGERPPDLGLRLNSLLAPGIFQVLAGVPPKLKSLFS